MHKTTAKNFNCSARRPRGPKQVGSAPNPWHVADEASYCQVGQLPRRTNSGRML